VTGRILPILLAALGLMALWATPAQAHMVSAEVGDFYAGLLHPLSSAEHLLPLLGVAFLASQSGPRAGRTAVWLLPLALVVGILGGMHWPSSLGAGGAVALGLLAAGCLAAGWPGVPLGLVAACLLTVGAGLGWRSGADWAASRAGWQFVPGLAATGLMLAALLCAWAPRLAGGGRGLVRVLLGAGFAGYGGLLLVQAILGDGFGPGRLVGLSLLPDGEGLQAFLRDPAASPLALAAALVSALAWGAAHALTPGHGKALVGAYLAGSRGTWRQAVWLGLTVAVTHTLGVFVLGAAAVLAAGRVDQDRLFPWLSLASGLGMLTVGGAMAVRRLGRAGDGHGHDHGHGPGDDGHSHAGGFHSHGGAGHSHGGSPAAGAGDFGWRTLLALGVSGGLVPCPSALALMLGSIALGRALLGLALTAAFGLGLAGVLTLFGLLCLRGVTGLEASGTLARAAGWLPLVGAVLIAGIGAVATIAALAELGLWPAFF
jgi:ABC-type nickel/cobalt efflux system permease component RcnA/hydrogenase/urease accessory protein HupE